MVIAHCSKPATQDLVTEYSATILKNMAGINPAAGRLITKSEALQHAVDVVKLKGGDNNEGLPKACAGLLAVLSESEENRADMCYTNNFLDSLENCLTAQIEQVQHSVFTVLANLALDSYMKLRMSDDSEKMSVMQKIIGKQLYAPFKDHTRVQIARIVANITVDVTTHDRIIDKRSGETAQKKSWETFCEGACHTLSNTQSSEVQVQFARIFRNLACTESTREKIVNYNAPSALFQLIKDTDIKNKAVHYWAAAAIAAIAETPKLHPRIMNQKALRPLVTFAACQTSKNDDDVRTRHYAAMTLASLALEDANREMIIQEGGLVPLILWSKGFGNNDVQKAALKALDHLGVNQDMEGDAMDEEAEYDADAAREGTTEIGAKELVMLAASKMAAVQEYAANEIANMALNRSELTNLIAKNALPAVINLMVSANENVQVAAHRALLNISYDDDGMVLDDLYVQETERQVIVDKKKAAGTMKKRAVDNKLYQIKKTIKVKEKKIEDYVNCLSFLLKQLTSSPDNVKRLCVVTMANLTQKERIREALLRLEKLPRAKDGEQQHQGGIFDLVQAVSAGGTTHIRVQAARAIFNLCSNEDCAQKVYELKGLNACLLNCIAGQKINVQLRRLCVGTIAQLAAIPDMRQKFQDPEKPLRMAERLVVLAYDTREDSIVQEQIARGIAMLALSDAFKQDIVDAHGAELLIRWAGSSRTSVQVQAAKALCNLLEDKHGHNMALKTTLIRLGALQVLFTLSQVGAPLARLQVIRVLRQMRKIKHNGEWEPVLEFMLTGGITPLLHLCANPPGEPGDTFYIQVREQAAQELCYWMSSSLEFANIERQSEMAKIVSPILAPLLIVTDSWGQHQSHPALRTQVLEVFERMLHKRDHKVEVTHLLARDETRKELYILWMEIKAQESRERKAAKRAAKGKAPEERQPGDQDPHDEYTHTPEFRYACKNTIDMLRRAGKLDEEDEQFLDTDEYKEMKSKGPAMDLALQDKFAQMKEDGEAAAQDGAAVSSALDKLQDQMMQLQVSKLNQNASTRLKKVFKVVVVGDISVGKSSIIYRYCNQKEPPKSMTATMGCEYRAKLVERVWNGVTILLQIFDIQGHERYRKACPRSFFKDAHGAIVVFDCAKDSHQSYYNSSEWKKTCDRFFDDMGRKDAPCILMANKSDLSNEHKFSTVRNDGMMKDTCRDHGYISWHAVSAKDGLGLRDSSTTAFDSLVDEMLKWESEGKYAKDGEEIVDLDEHSSGSGGCLC